MNVVAPWLEEEKEWPLSPEVSHGAGSTADTRRGVRPSGLIIEDSPHPLQGGGGSWSEGPRMRHHYQNPLRWTPEVLSLAFGILCMAGESSGLEPTSITARAEELNERAL